MLLIFIRKFLDELRLFGETTILADEFRGALGDQRKFIDSFEEPCAAADPLASRLGARFSMAEKFEVPGDA